MFMSSAAFAKTIKLTSNSFNIFFSSESNQCSYMHNMTQLVKCPYLFRYAAIPLTFFIFNEPILVVGTQMFSAMLRWLLCLLLKRAVLPCGFASHLYYGFGYYQNVAGFSTVSSEFYIPRFFYEYIWLLSVRLQVSKCDRTVVRHS